MKKIEQSAVPWLLAGGVALLLAGCQSRSTSEGDNLPDTARSFNADAAFLKKHHPDLVTLQEGQAQVLICPAYQGRVMTSTADGQTSYGWINRDLIQSGKRQPHMNAFGGEDRFWLGPEGGQFGLFFQKGQQFNADDWQTPAPLDSEPFTVVSKEASSARFARNFRLTNYSGTTFDVGVERQIRLLRSEQVSQALGATGVPMSDSLKVVGIESINTLINRGKQPWTKEGGLLSVWILGMFNAAPKTTVIVPFRPGAGPGINDSYFGKVPSSRLVLKDTVAYFKADANHRGKIGVSPGRAKNWLGSYDPATKTLTLVTFTFNPTKQDYVNSLWEVQKEPYKGDVVNAYNDGPMKPGGSQMGQFYEMESSSPVAALRPNERLTHTHTTLHLQGETNQLDRIARQWLGVSLEEISHAF